MDEFREEARTWVKRIQTAPRHTDTMSTATEVFGELHQMRVKQLQALSAGDHIEARRIELEIAARESSIKQFQKEMPALVSNLERDE